MRVPPFDPTVHTASGRALSPIAEDCPTVSPASSSAFAIPPTLLVVVDDDIAELPMETPMPPPAPHEVPRRPLPLRAKAARQSQISVACACGGVHSNRWYSWRHGGPPPSGTKADTAADENVYTMIAEVDQDGVGAMTWRDVWRCCACAFPNFADRQVCHRCGTRSLGHTLRYGGLPPPFSRQTHIALSRKRPMTPGETEPPPEPPMSAPVYDHGNTGAASSSQGASSKSQMAFGPPPLPSPIPVASGHTVHVNLNLILGSRDLDGEPGQLLAASLRTFMGAILLPNKRRRVLACSTTPSPVDSDDVIEQPDPFIATLADQLSGLTTKETFVPPATNTIIAVNSVLHATAADNDASRTVTTMDADVEATDVEAATTTTGMESASTNDQALVAAMSQRAEPPPSTTGAPGDAVLSAAIAETGATPNAAT